MAGIWVGDRLEPASGGWSGLALALACLGPLAARSIRARGLIALVLTALSGTLSIGEALERAADRRIDEIHVVDVEARPCGAGPNGSGLVLCDAVVVGDRGRSSLVLPTRILLSVEPGGEDERVIGRGANRDRIRTRLRVEPLQAGRNPGGRDARRALARRGIGARARLVDPALWVAIETDAQPADRPGLSIVALRSRLARRLATAGHGGELLAALAVGERSVLSDPTRQAFARLGIVHLLVVSGLHVAIAAGLAFTALRFALTGALARLGVADPRHARAVLSLGFAAGYGTLAGLGVPLQRALWMAGVVVLAFGSRRRWPARHALCVAISAVLAFDPAALFDAGAQLSFAAAGALMLAPRGERDARADSRAGRVVASLRENLRTAAIALAATAPVLAAHGMGAGVWGLAVNVVAVPITAFGLLPLAGVAALVAGLAPSTWIDGLLAGLVAPAGLALDAVVALARALPRDPPSVPAIWPVWLSAGLLALAAIRARSDWVRVGLVVALACWLRTPPVPRVDPPAPRLVAFDVGQGDAILVQGRSGTLLVDGGRRVPGLVDAGERIVVPGLAALGLDRLDVVVATHADIDHRGGLESVLERLPVGALWLPSGGLAQKAFLELREIAAAKGVRIEEVDAASRTRRIGDLEVDVLWPPAGPSAGSSNDRSIVLRVGLDGDRVLLTGDAGREVERQLLAERRDLRARVLKVGHHGSDGSSEAAFLDAVDAQIAIVSAGCGARSGLPTARVLARLEDAGASLAWTGRDGAVIVPLGVRRDDHSPRAWGERKRCPGDPARPLDDGMRVAPRSASD